MASKQNKGKKKVKGRNIHASECQLMDRKPAVHVQTRKPKKRKFFLQDFCRKKETRVRRWVRHKHIARQLKTRSRHNPKKKKNNTTKNVFT
jgi:hypothetical protein